MPVYIDSSINKSFFLRKEYNIVAVIMIIFYFMIFSLVFLRYKSSHLHHCYKQQYANEIFAIFEKMGYYVILILCYRSTLFRAHWGPRQLIVCLTDPVGGLTDLLKASPAHWGPEQHTGAFPTYWGPHGPTGGFTDLVGT